MEKNIKNRLLIYSDCYIYGGSERLLSSIISNEVIKDKYDIYFAYRRHRSYEDGLNDDYGSKQKNFYPLFIFSNNTIFHKINTLSLPNLAKIIVKIPLWLFQKIGLYAFYNFFVMFFVIKIRSCLPDK